MSYFMNMEEHNHDWLDQRLASESYLPDDGFTASVMQQVPKTRKSMVQRRTTILLLAGTVAAGVVAALLPSTVEALSPALNHAVAANVPNFHGIWKSAGTYLQMPWVRYGTLPLLTLAALPLLRRWA